MLFIIYSNNRYCFIRMLIYTYLTNAFITRYIYYLTIIITFILVGKKKNLNSSIHILIARHTFTCSCYCITSTYHIIDLKSGYIHNISRLLKQSQTLQSI